ncbi:phosphoglycolate phosphatase-like HAD superfamily hydrolase [Kribbella amoyensis]|uniref:Phosphoglycolate phosphatase-like HAD superfamily hydrolase n=1 Tax=Kribbella amoyensis TaxID=996641 RepID=A0A561BR96_9ACTN|nr:HAD family hydrolase [Kribbella amoyensis]TWD81283.1 phosphoglycolate phosphatase-like HAD superfamily hydrolase [Kribbella amoyensis]
MHEPEAARRVRPHVARAVALTKHVLLEFDGVMFDVETALGPWGRENAIGDFLRSRPYFPRPIMLGAYGPEHMLGFIAEHKPEYAAEAEQALEHRELDAALTSRPADGLRQLLAACAATGRTVAVISDLAEDVVTTVVRSNELSLHVNAISARQGFDLAGFRSGHAAHRAAELLGVPIEACLFVGGRSARISSAREAGAVGLGCECGREPRKHLASPEIPVVPNLATLTKALLSTPRP